MSQILNLASTMGRRQQFPQVGFDRGPRSRVPPGHPAPCRAIQYSYVQSWSPRTIQGSPPTLPCNTMQWSPRPPTHPITQLTQPPQRCTTFFSWQSMCGHLRGAALPALQIFTVHTQDLRTHMQAHQSAMIVLGAINVQFDLDRTHVGTCRPPA